MAKKKGRRSANVARKREKRKRDQKSRHKQIAVEKQRRLRYEKSEEEHLHACISQSQQLLDEPEFKGILFDPELMYIRVMELLNDYGVEASRPSADESVEELPFTRTNVLDKGEQFDSTLEAEAACENFRVEVLPHLVTPEFRRHLMQALTASETRFKLTGNRKFAEVAYVTRNLFEAAPPEILAFHPMIQTIGIETLRVLVEEQDLIVEWREGVKEILSDVLKREDAEVYPSQEISALSARDVSDTRPEDAGTELMSPYVDVIDAETEAGIPSVLPDLGGSRPEGTLPPQPEVVPHVETSIPETVSPPVGLSPDELPARALYKNFSGLAIRENFKGRVDKVPSENGMRNYVLVHESEDHIEFVDVENKRYIKVTEDRVQLHARSETELSLAMGEVEAQCASALMYLAKTIEERG